MGIISSDNTKIDRMLSDATMPNSLRSLLSVMMKVANPAAVVALVNKVAFPTFRNHSLQGFALIIHAFYLLLIFVYKENTIRDTNDYN